MNMERRQMIFLFSSFIENIGIIFRSIFPLPVEYFVFYCAETALRGETASNVKCE